MTMLALFTFDVLVPPVIILPFLAVPVLLSAQWFPPNLVAVLAVLNVLLAAVSGLVNDYFGSLNDVLWMSALAVVGLVAFGASRARVRLEQRQAEAAGRLQAAMDAEFDPHVLLEAIRDQTGRIVDFVYADANPKACEYNRLARSELVGARLLALFPGHLATGLLESYAKVVETGEPLVLNDFSYEQERHGGVERRYDVRGVKVGESISYTWRDVTDRYEERQLLAESEERYRLLAENSSDVVVRFRDPNLIWVSPSLSAALGWRPEDWSGHPLAEFTHPEDLQILAESRAHMTTGRPYVFRLRLADFMGSWHWVEMHCQVFRNHTGHPDGFLSSFRVIDREVQAEGFLERRATHDDLTGVLKRDPALRQLSEMTRHPRAPGSETAVLFVDVDDFKQVNDTFGHAAGDAVLRRFSDVIRSSVRSGDTVARLGGDEFLVILTGLHDLTEGTSIAEKIRAGCAEPIELHEGTVSASVSIGVALSDPAESGDDLMARADAGMYAAKAAGRNRVTIVPRLRESA